LSPAPAPSLYLHRLLSYCYGAHRDLHSFPTRRSSDLHAIRQMPRLAKQLRDQLTALNEEMLETAIEAPLAELAERYRGHDGVQRSEEHTSELQSRFDLVCRLLLEKKK